MPTFKYPWVIQLQLFKKGRWTSHTAIRLDQGLVGALEDLERTKKLFPQHNARLLCLEIIE